MTAPKPTPPAATTRPEPRPYDIRDTFLWTHHAKKQAREKGLSMRECDDAVMLPEITYPSLRVKGQERRIRGRVCAVVDAQRGVLVTVYLHNVRTPLRSDQTDADALASDALARKDSAQ